MMKTLYTNIVILIIFIGSFFHTESLFAQYSKKITVEWNGIHKIELPNQKIQSLPKAKNAYFHANGVMYYSFKIEGNIENIQLVAVEEKTIDSIQLPKSQAQLEYSVSTFKGVQYTQVDVPVLFTNELGNTIQRVSFELNYTVSTKVLSKNNNPSTNYSLFKTTSISNSVLSTGDWYKVGVNKDNVYKIDYNYLVAIGISPASINLDQFQVFGNGGGMLPQANSDPRVEDLLEVPIEVIDNNTNNLFDTDDYILFYGQSPHTWTLNTSNNLYEHIYNLYDESNYYFFTFNQNSGKRIQTKAPIVSPAQSISNMNERAFIEKDLYNILQSGREWYGDLFNQFNTTYTYNFPINDVESGTTLFIRSNLLNRSYISTSATIYANGNLLGIQTMNAMGQGSHDALGVPSNNLYTINESSLAGNNLSLQYVFNKNGSNASIANINYVSINFSKKLNWRDANFTFRNIVSTSQSTCEYTITNSSTTTKVWNVFSQNECYALSSTLNGNTLTVTDSSLVLNEYICFDAKNCGNPSFIQKVVNQDLHALSSNIPDAILLTSSSIASVAQRLANFRNSFSNIDVKIVTVDEVYNEFSSGKQDVSAIRDFMRYLYKNSTASDSIHYLILFGDASYDYKDRITNNTNVVPIYESRESLLPIESHPSDDYFGMLDDNEGTWAESFSNKDNIDIAIGRLPVRNANEANEMINKIINYEQNQSCLDNWRNIATFSADDGDINLHLDDAESVSSIASTYNPLLNLNKIYIDMYPQESTPGGETAKLVEDAINKSINEGTLIFNYSGHGGVFGLAQEVIISINSISNWHNYDRLAFMITATCDFGRFDDPNRYSGAETSMSNTFGGACGIFTSTRTVYQFANLAMNESLMQFMFLKDDQNNWATIGKAMQAAKNYPPAIIGVYNRNYCLLADPCMTLAFPKEKIVINTINNNPIGQDTLKALSKASIQGSVLDQQNVLMNSYQGEAYITVFDKPNSVRTLGLGNSLPVDIKIQNNYIYNGPATITNGKFNLNFVVPKDISYNYDQGKISTYGKTSNTLIDAGGNETNFIIGGTNPNATVDNTPPKISLFINDSSFVNGGIVNANSLNVRATIYDENGINLSSSGIGHEITLFVNNASTPIILNKYFTNNINDYTTGKISYPMSNLSPGEYSLRLKVWDSYNNSSEETLKFTVLNTESITMSHVLNYPNPFSTKTDFQFDHNRQGDDLQVQIDIFTVSGKRIKTLEETFYNAPSHISGLFWDGLDEYQDKIGRGVYVYRVKIRSIRDGSTYTKYEKLVLLN